MSLGARLMNVVATPGEVFEQVRDNPPDHANWWLPLVLFAVLGIISTWVIFSQPSIIQRMHEAQEQAMEKQMANVPPAQRQQAMDMAERFSGPAMLKLVGVVTSVGGSAFWLFGMALVMWAVAVIFYKAPVTYLKAMEASGLAMMIMIVSVVVNLLLILIIGNVMARPSPALFLSNSDPTTPAFMLLNAFDVMTLWYLAVAAIGMGRLCRRSMLVPALCLYGIWAVLKFGLIGLSIFAQSMTSS
jgi:hypothetical protein